jgi:hypothetical protein
MKARTLFLTAALCFIGTAVCFADNPNMGTWKLNTAKSHIPAGLPTNTTVVYEAAGDQIKVTTDGTDKEGKPTHTEWVGKWDGKPYPLTGDASADSRSYKMSGTTLTFSNTKDGKVVMTGHIVVSPDGKTRTLHATATDASGKKVSGTQVFDKQ